MRDDVRAGTVMIRAGTLIPHSIRAEAEPFWRDWRKITGWSGAALDRDIRKAGWNFFFLATNIQVMVWGSWGKRNIETALKRVLGRGGAANFNCLEVTEISARRFIGIPYLLLSAHSRHIQEGSFLHSMAERTRAQLDAAWAVG